MRISREGPEAIPELEPLWLALQAHHGEVAPGFGPMRTPADSWAMRRARYEQWLAEPGAFVLVARGHDGRAAGYALVVLREHGPSWTGAADRIGDVETLVVLPEARGHGLGHELLAAARAHLATLGVVQVQLTVVAPNAAARRFYAREGFGEAFLVLRRDVS